jgi:ABC-2 type transport system permease protein/lipopolysaccharide transport system permease protein
LGGFAPRATSFWVPLYFAIQVLFTGGVVLVMAGAVIYIRDIRHVLTLALQVGLFATPVVYALTVIPQKFRLLYVVVNPLGAVIDGYRRAVLFGQGPDWPYVIASGTSALVVAAVGYWAFKKMEPGVADIS